MTVQSKRATVVAVLAGQLPAQVDLTRLPRRHIQGEALRPVGVERDLDVIADYVPDRRIVAVTADAHRPGQQGVEPASELLYGLRSRLRACLLGVGRRGGECPLALLLRRDRGADLLRERG
jgi:hypothetical protein